VLRGCNVSPTKACLHMCCHVYNIVLHFATPCFKLISTFVTGFNLHLKTEAVEYFKHLATEGIPNFYNPDNPECLLRFAALVHKHTSGIFCS
jgi:hypothetical protein